MRKLISTLTILSVCIIISLSFVSNVFAWGNLKDKIQEELDINPFLKKQGIKLRVTDETSGYVTIEMYEGNRKLIERITNGTDILTGQIEQQWFWGNASKDEKESVKILRKTINYIKKMEDVKEVLLTSSANELSILWDKFLSALQKNNLQSAYNFYSEKAKKEYGLSFDKFKQMWGNEETMKILANTKIIKAEQKDDEAEGYLDKPGISIHFIYENNAWFINER